jgi:hypothetical protein
MYSDLLKSITGKHILFREIIAFNNKYLKVYVYIVKKTRYAN